ncbi:MAG: hypothetical protein PVI26_00780 [Chitinispirillia bacterium]|jgi:hypothetical protein
MRERQSTLIKVLILGITTVVYSQSVTFHSPIPWTTLRNGKINAKTLIDTAEIKKKTVNLKLYKVENGKKRSLAIKSFKPVDYSYETKLSEIKGSVLGGTDFLRIEWDVAGSDKKGYIEPFGIVQLSEKVDENQWKCKEVSGTIDLNVIKNSLKESDFNSIGKVSFCLVWNKEIFGLVYKNSKGMTSIKVFFDGKNGKNAFISFSDRELEYFPENDSINTIYYKRDVSDSGIVYTSHNWIQEIQKKAGDNLVLISIPWYDLGIIAKEKRRFGFAIFINDDKQKSIALPEKAREKIPGTWGNIVLTKS